MKLFQVWECPETTFFFFFVHDPTSIPKHAHSLFLSLSHTRMRTRTYANMHIYFLFKCFISFTSEGSRKKIHETMDTVRSISMSSLTIHENLYRSNGFLFTHLLTKQDKINKQNLSPSIDSCTHTLTDTHTHNSGVGENQRQKTSRARAIWKK